MRPLMIFFGLCMIRKSIEKLQFHGDEEAVLNQSLCAKTIFRKYFHEHSNILVYSLNSNDIVNSLPKLPIFVATEWDFVRRTVFGDSKPMIIFLEGNSNQDSHVLKRLRGFVMVHPVLIVCTTSAICSSEMYINGIIEIAESPGLHYVALNRRGILDMYKRTTTNEERCGTPYLVRVGHCSEKSTTKKAFRMSLNFHKCPIRIMTWTSPPYSRPCYANEKNKVCGIEGRVLEIIAEKINATPKVLRVQTPEDVRRLLAHQFGDVGFGKMAPQRYVGISYSKAYLFIETTVIVPHSRWASKGLMGNIFLPLEFEVWLGVGVVMIVNFALELLVPYFRKINALEQFGVCLGVPAPRPPRELPSRIYLMSLLLFGYICMQAYLSNLTRAFVASGQQMIRTLDDLEESSLSVIGPPESREKFKNEYPRIYKDFHTQPYPEYYAEITKLLMNESESVLYLEASRSFISKWRGGKALENGITWYPVVTAIRNSSAILSFANDIFPLIMESGILLRNGILPPKTDRSVEYSDPTSVGTSERVLRFHDLGVVFFMLIVGLCMSFTAFLIEILLTQYMKMKIRLKGREGPESN